MNANADLYLSVTMAANDEYEDTLKSPGKYPVTIAMMERRWGFRPGRLKNYRANHLSRHRKQNAKDD